MAKNKHTFAKRQREMDKKRKADEKRAKRRDKNPDSDPDAQIEGADETEAGDLNPPSTDETLSG